MSSIDRILGKKEPYEEPNYLTEEQEEFLREENFECSEYTDDKWLYSNEKDPYTIDISVNKSGYMTLTVGIGKFPDEYEVDETYFFVQDDFDEKYEQMRQTLKKFFNDDSDEEENDW